jgi:murein hydrolase activator
VISLLLVLCFLMMSAGASGQQSRKGLEDKRKQLLKDIERTSSLLKQTKQSKEATFSLYITLQKQIAKRQQLIETLQTEIAYMVSSVERTSNVIEALTGDAGRLRDEYAGMARHAYRQRLSRSNWLFIFSASNFNDAFRRWQYLRQYDRYRQKQARLILETQKSLMDKINILEQRKVDKQRLLDSERRQSEMLGLEMNAKNRLFEALKDDESRLNKELQTKEMAAAKLSAAIERIIKEEMARAGDANKASSSATKASAEKALALSKDFQKNKGRLPWPVKHGVITGYFGKQQHPTIKTVDITNNGIDIRTDQGAPVRAVFEGKVAGTQFIPGYNYMVILQHGLYYTVYSNLEEVNVKKGGEVKTRQTIGKVSTDRKTNTSEVHFEIWKEKRRLNPSHWVAGK